MITAILLLLNQPTFATLLPDKFEYKTQDVRSISLHNSSGNVDVAPVTGKKVFVVVHKKAWSEDCKLNVTLEKGELKVIVDDKTWVRDQQCRADMVVSAPEKTPLQLRAGTGDVKVLSKKNRIDVKVGSGLISVRGEIAHLKALSGSGDIRLNGEASDVEAKTGSGDIALYYDQLPKDSNLRLQTGSGDVEVVLPHQASVSSQISTGNGTVINDFERSEKPDLSIHAASGTGNIQIRKR